MPDVSYVPGPLTAVAGDQCWALVEASPDSPAVTRIWQGFVQGAAADALLASLLAGGVGGVPGFALLTAGTTGGTGSSAVARSARPWSPPRRLVPGLARPSRRNTSTEPAC